MRFGLADLPKDVSRDLVDDRSKCRVELGSKDFVWAMVSGLVFFSATLLWFSLDHHVPMMDEAGHIIHGLSYRDLLSHASVLKGSWWYSMLTVNQFYPPVVYFLTGLLRAVVANTLWMDVIVHCGFTFVLASSMVLAGRLMGLPLRASVLASVFINLFPGITSVNHQFMLDFPATAAVAAGLLALLAWQRSSSPFSAIWAGVVLGLCCLTKQIVAAFLIGAGGYMVAKTIWPQDRSGLRGRLIQLTVMVVVTCFVGLPWILANYSFSKQINDYMRDCLFDAGLTFSFLGNLVTYAGSLTSLMSPFLATLFLVALILQVATTGGRLNQVRLLPVIVMAVFGIVLMSTFIYPLERYIMPALLYPAFCLGLLLDGLLSERKLTNQAGSLVILLLVFFQYLSFNFAPYPLTVSALNKFSKAMGVETQAPAGKGGVKDNPVPRQDWGYEWVAAEMERIGGNRAVYLNIMINDPDLNAQSFDLFFREKKLPFFATTSRIWAVNGDIVEFSPEKALYFQWYLFKTGRTGFGFKDEASAESFKKLEDFVKKGDHFKLVGSHPTPDGGFIELYGPAR